MGKCAYLRIHQFFIHFWFYIDQRKEKYLHEMFCVSVLLLLRVWGTSISPFPSNSKYLLYLATKILSSVNNTKKLVLYLALVLGKYVIFLWKDSLFQFLSFTSFKVPWKSPPLKKINMLLKFLQPLTAFL